MVVAEELQVRGRDRAQGEAGRDRGQGEAGRVRPVPKRAHRDAAPQKPTDDEVDRLGVSVRNRSQGLGTAVNRPAGQPPDQAVPIGRTPADLPSLALALAPTVQDQAKDQDQVTARVQAIVRIALTGLTFLEENQASPESATVPAVRIDLAEDIALVARRMFGHQSPVHPAGAHRVTVRHIGGRRTGVHPPIDRLTSGRRTAIGADTTGIRDGDGISPPPLRGGLSPTSSTFQIPIRASRRWSTVA